MIADSRVGGKEMNEKEGRMLQRENELRRNWRTPSEKTVDFSPFQMRPTNFAFFFPWLPRSMARRRRPFVIADDKFDAFALISTLLPSHVGPAASR